MTAAGREVKDGVHVSESRRTLCTHARKHGSLAGGCGAAARRRGVVNAAVVNVAPLVLRRLRIQDDGLRGLPRHRLGHGWALRQDMGSSIDQQAHLKLDSALSVQASYGRRFNANAALDSWNLDNFGVKISSLILPPRLPDDAMYVLSL